MDVSLYEDALFRRMMFWAGFCILLGLAFTVGIWWNYCSSTDAHHETSSKDAWETKFLHYLTYVLCVGGLIGSIALSINTISKCSYDIKHQAYIIWEGDFIVCQDGPGKSRWYLPDEDGIKLEGNDLSEGEYNGRIIYGARSKVVLDFCIEEIED